MTAEYRPVEYGKDYDVVNNPDKFQLYIDGKEVNQLVKEYETKGEILIENFSVSTTAK